MPDSKSNLIVCAVRGQPTSRATVTRAIDLALEDQARLIFLHITNIDFLKMAGPILSSTQTVYKQLRDLAEFTMLILCDRAQRRGVKEIDAVIREGNIKDQLYQFLVEVSPTLLVIGEPRPDHGVPVFAGVELDDFLQMIKLELNLDAEIVRA